MFVKVAFIARLIHKETGPHCFSNFMSPGLAESSSDEWHLITTRWW